MTFFATSVRQSISWAGLGVLLGALFLLGCDSEDLGSSDPSVPTINEIVTEVPALSLLQEALTKNNLINDLDGAGPFTVIAPLNSAFTPIEEGEIRTSALAKRILRGHVIAERVDSSDFDLGETLTFQTLAGNSITLTAGDNQLLSSVNNAAVTNADVNAANGVVHVVDGVLADAVDRALLTPSFEILADLVVQENLAAALRTDGLTIFAPSNDAFLALLDADDSGAIESDELQGVNVSAVLQGHVHAGVFSGAAFLDDDDADAFPKDTTLTALSGPDIVLRTNADGDSLFVNPDDENAVVTNADVKVNNGLIHGINAVLVP